VTAAELLDQGVAAAFFGRFMTLRDAQEAAIEPLISGRNVILSSATGTGKTEAVVAPLVSRYWRAAANLNSVFLLYIAPTKALVNDLEKRLRPPLSNLGLRLGVRHGDRDDLTTGAKPQLLITTPESFDVLLFRKEPMLSSIRAVVIDEVHLLYNTQRGLQLSILISRLRELLSDKLQWAALSATIGNLRHVRDFLMGQGEDAEFLSFPAQRVLDAQIRGMSSQTAFVTLVHRLTEQRATKLLVFVNSRRECEQLTGALQHENGLRHSVFAHYSSLAPDVRLDTERKFASMQTAICVATSTLELGIDIGDIDAVLLWGVPGGVDSFLQRIGRSNRRSKKTNVVCLVPAQSPSVILDALRFAALIDAAGKGELPIRAPYELFGAVGQQCLSVIASHEGRFTRVADFCKLVEHHSHLGRDPIEAILAELATKEFLQHHGYKNRYGAEEKLHRLVDLKFIYGNFGMGSQTVEVCYGEKRLGDVPAFNLMRLRKGMSVRFAGKCWRVQKLLRTGIGLEPSRSTSDAVDFSYVGEGIHTDVFIAERIWRLLYSEDFMETLFVGELKRQVMGFRETLRKACSQEQIPYHRSINGIRYFTFGGGLVNKAVGLRSGKPNFQADDFSLLVPSPIEWASIPNKPEDYEEVFHLLFGASSQQSIYQQQLPLDLQRREFLQDWLKHESIPHVLERLSGASTVQVDGLLRDAMTESQAASKR
jgi:ATP-dependent helicase Lhr and Lhr-like helicase